MDYYRTGIKERRILKDKATSDIGMHAVNSTREDKSSASEIDLVICATATPDMLFHQQLVLLLIRWE